MIFSKFRLVFISISVTVICWGALQTGSVAFAFSSKAATTSENSSSANTVWVTRSDGSKMCTPESGQSLEDGSNELKKAQIRVITSEKGSDKKMHAQMCGLPSGHTNAYQISKDDLPKANVLGYTEIK